MKLELDGIAARTLAYYEQAAQDILSVLPPLLSR